MYTPFTSQLKPVGNSSAPSVSPVRVRLKWTLIFAVIGSLTLIGVDRISSAMSQLSLGFTAATPYAVPPAGSHPHSVAAFNRFGKPALAVTNQSDNSVGVFYGQYVNGQYDGTFITPATRYSLLAGSQPQGIVVGNLGQLNLPCLVIAASGANKVAVLLGNSDDTFQAPVYKDVGTFPESVTLGDFNGDGNLDIAAANFGSSTISVLLGNSDRSFQNAVLVGSNISANPEFIVAGDFNGDGKIDLATCNSGSPGNNKVNVLIGNGNGTFQAAVPYVVGTHPFFLATGDFNGDGKLDIVTSNHTSSDISLLLNNGNGTFHQPAANLSLGFHSNALVGGDFNIDGFSDLAVTNETGGAVSVFLNNGSGAFQPGVNPTVGTTPIGITAGDFNLDGKSDIAAVTNGDGNVNVLLNTSAPTIAPPANDNFASAQTLSGVSGRVNGTTAGATHEANEPQHAAKPGTSSVWYSWTAPANGGATFDTFTSTFDTALAVYTGSGFGALTEIASGDNDLGSNGDSRVSSRVKFNTIAGTTYRIAVDSGGSGVATGPMTLNWSLLSPPQNDNFSAAEIISGTTGTVRRTNAGATKEASEPNHAGNPGGSSIWFRWTTPSNDTFNFSTSGSILNGGPSAGGSQYDTLLAVYTGSSLISLDPNPCGNSPRCNDDETTGVLTSFVSFPATQGTTYQIAVDTKGPAKGEIVLSWSVVVSNLHETYATALPISNSSGSATSAMGSNNVAWFRWVAPTDGSFAFSSRPFGGGGSDQRLSDIHAYFSGTTSVGTTTTGSCRFSPQICDDTVVKFDATAGATYGISVNRPPGTTGDASLSWAPSPPLTNDNLANAQVINGLNGALLFNNSGATAEQNEPAHVASPPGGRSIWYSWTAPASYRVRFSAGSFFSPGRGDYGIPILAVYTGSSYLNPPLTTTLVVNGIPNVSFDAVQGTTYRIALDNISTGTSTFEWSPDFAPENDNFATSQTISGASGKVLGTNVRATKETGEQNHAGNSGGGSIWYSWTPATSGLVTFNTDNSQSFVVFPPSSVQISTLDTLLAVYTGSSVNNLSEVVTNDNENLSPAVPTSRVTFNAIAGTTYRIAVDGKNSARGAITLNWGTPRSIGGRVTDIRGVGIANTLITLSGSASRRRLTDSQGNYLFSNLPQTGSYTVTPDTALFTFDVASRSYCPQGAPTCIRDLSTNVTDANFIAQTPTYSIAGFLKSLSGAAIANVAVTLTGTNIPAGTSVQTTADGAYSFTNLTTDGDYTVTPVSALYAFNATILPTEHSYTFRTLNSFVSNADFSGIVTTFSISGQITSGGVGIGGVTVTLSGSASANTMTDGAGNYSFNGLTGGGNYTVTPSKAGYVFNPGSVPINNLTSNSTANFVGTPIIQVTVQTNPAGRSFTVDGTAYTSSQTFNWISASAHSLSTTSPQNDVLGTQYLWSNWSDGGVMSHTVAPTANTTYTATFTTQYQLTMNAGAGGNVSPASGFFNSGQNVQISATPNSGFNFSGWTGSGPGSFTGSTNPATLTMNGPITETANFIQGPPPTGNLVQFSSATYSVNEASGSIDITINRSGDTSTSASVALSIGNGQTGCGNNNGLAAQNCDYLGNSRTVNFAIGQNSQAVTILIVDDNYVEGNETLEVKLTNPSGVALGAFNSATLTIVDNDSIVPVTNPLENPEFFVRQHYYDFLNRVPDQGGLDYWAFQLRSCGADQVCLVNKRVEVSAGYFGSPEFQRTGSFVYGAFKGGLGRLPTYGEFSTDRPLIVEGPQLEQTKQAYISGFVRRPAFLAKYVSATTGPTFVDALIASIRTNSQVDLLGLRQTLLDQYNLGGSMDESRALATRAAIESQLFLNGELYRAFVLMQFFGYLGRDIDQGGYDFWVDVLTNHEPKGNFRGMVCGFIDSPEYQQRFSNKVTRSDHECALLP